MALTLNIVFLWLGVHAERGGKYRDTLGIPGILRPREFTKRKVAEVK